jgi:hypothetical protein
MKCIKTLNEGIVSGRLADSCRAENQTLCAGIHEYEGKQVVSVHIWKLSKKKIKMMGLAQRLICSSQEDFSRFAGVKCSLPLSYGISLAKHLQVGGPRTKPLSSGLSR